MAVRTFWRIVRSNPPTRRDFLSHAALGLLVRSSNADAVRQSQGISVFHTEAQARRQARRYPFLGQWLAELDISGAGNISVERTPGGAGHHTIWAEADDLLALVVRVVDA